MGELWSSPAVTSYSTESHLQEVLAGQPGLLPGVSSSPVAVRELQTGAGPLDVVVIDAEGQLTLVECKLASNAQIRREIVGQVLDYVHNAGALETVTTPMILLPGRAEADLMELSADLGISLAARDGDIRALVTEPWSPTRYSLERVLSIDTTAAGGNASLLAAAGFVLLSTYAPDFRLGQQGGASALSKSGTGFAGLVDGMVDRIIDSLGADPDHVTVVATGSYPEAVLDQCGTITTRDPWLTLTGLRLIHERNQ